MKTEVRSDWAGAILVCGKCSRKSGRRPSLVKSLRKAAGGGKGRRVTLGVVETKCLGICPKRGIVVIDTARLDRWQIIAPDVSVEEVIARLSRGQA